MKKIENYFYINCLYHIGLCVSMLSVTTVVGKPLYLSDDAKQQRLMGFNAAGAGEGIFEDFSLLRFRDLEVIGDGYGRYVLFINGGVCQNKRQGPA